MTAATTTITTMSNAASIVSMPFLFPVIFLIFFTPFVFPVGLSLLVPQFGCKAGTYREDGFDVCVGTVVIEWRVLGAVFMRGFFLRCSSGYPYGLPRRPK